MSAAERKTFDHPDETRSFERGTLDLVDLGRPPVAGLVEPERELERLGADRMGLTMVTTEGA